ncbi:MAG: hypothetical protein ACJ74Q_15395 [Pyrinomonadaceae bacterium]
MDRLEKFPDLIDWCNHGFVSLKSWHCPDCNYLLNEQARQRLLAAPTLAPKGYLWVLQERSQPDFVEEDEEFDSVHLFTDRSKIARLIVRGGVMGPISLREKLNQIHWYQGVYNVCLFEGWDEVESHPSQYSLSLSKIDNATP